MGHVNWCSSVCGPVYIRQLRGSARPQTDYAVLLVSDLAMPSSDALQLALRTAVRESARLSVLHVLRPDLDQSEQAILERGFEIGEFLTAAVLRAAGAERPPSVRTVVFVGGPEEVIEFVTTTVRPTLVVAAQTRPFEPASGLREVIGRAQGCPVLLVPNLEPNSGDGAHLLERHESTLRLN